MSSRLRGVLAEAKHEAQRWAYLDLDHSLGATTVLAGSGRSGTTWVGELVDRHHDHRVVFEPLRADAVPLVRDLPHGLYLRPDDPGGRWREPLERILTGRFRNRWTDHQNHARLARRRLVKVIRGNNLLGWISRQFPEAHLVYLVRHPGAVAVSARTLGWRDHLDDLLAQPDLVADHLEPLLPLLGDLDRPWDRFVAQWCIENVVPLRLLDPASACLVLYEELCDHPDAEAARVLGALGQQPDARLREVVGRPSRLARSDSAVTVGDDLVSGWVARTTEGERQRLAELVGAFGLGEVWTADPRPDGDAARALFAEPWSAGSGRASTP